MRQLSLSAEAVMREFLLAMPTLCIRAWRSLLVVACVFYREGRQALLERAQARTDLEVLATEQKRMEMEFQRANHVVDLVQKVERIIDPQLRERASAAILSNCRASPIVHQNSAPKKRKKSKTLRLVQKS
jgi:hypothetical protein